MAHQNEQVAQIIYVTNNSFAISDDLSEYYKPEKPTPNWFVGTHKKRSIYF